MEVRKQDVNNPLMFPSFYFTYCFLLPWLCAELILLHFSHKTNRCTATLQDNSCHHSHY